MLESDRIDDDESYCSLCFINSMDNNNNKMIQLSKRVTYDACVHFTLFFFLLFRCRCFKLVPDYFCFSLSMMSMKSIHIHMKTIIVIHTLCVFVHTYITFMKIYIHQIHIYICLWMNKWKILFFVYVCVIHPNYGNEIIIIHV